MESYTQLMDIGCKGLTHGDTQYFDDYWELQETKNLRLIRIRVWYDDYVHGIQCVYETSNKGIVHAPRRMKDGTKTHKLKYKEVHFNRNESIVRVVGHAGAVIDHVYFITDRGREIRFGKSDGGEKFEFDIPAGYCVGPIKGGFGGHLHYIGCCVVPISAPLVYQYGYHLDKRVESTASAGPTHGDTMQYNDVEYLESTKGQHRIKAVTVYYDEECVFGLIVKYEECGKELDTRGVGSLWKRKEDQIKKITFDCDQYIKNMYGFIDTYCESLVIETTDGRVAKFGRPKEPNFNFNVPEGEVISGIAFGVGGHLHNLTVYYGKKPKAFRPPQPPSLAAQSSVVAHITEQFGGHHKDTRDFTDFGKLSPTDVNLRLRKICVYYNENKCVYGFEQEWESNGRIIYGGKHCGAEYDSWLCDGQKKKIPLKSGEFITRVYGRADTLVDRLCFELNTGTIYEFGGDGGNDFDLGIPQGHALGCLYGGYGGHLHYVQGMHGKVQTVAQVQPVIYYLPAENRWPTEIMVGKTHGDTSVFYDYGVKFNSSNYRLDTVKVWFSDKVLGIECIYEINGEYIYRGPNMASYKDKPEKVHVATLTMAVDEFITNVCVRAGSVIDSIHMHTNKANGFTAGGDGGEIHEVDIPEGYCVGYIGGGKNGHIHNFKFHIGPIPQVMISYP